MSEAGTSGKETFVQLHVDMVVLAGKESELESVFEKVFKPVISRQPGFVSVRLLRFRAPIVGDAPSDAQYRLVISFGTEEQRLAWVGSDDHQRVWPAFASPMERFKAYLFDGCN
jgi:heme-degrading monooxygenase HmoA